MGVSTGDDRDTSLADRLQQARANTRVYNPKNGKSAPATIKYMAETISGEPEYGVTVTRDYLNKLFNGYHVNPSFNVLSAMVTFFNAYQVPNTPPVTMDYLAGRVDTPSRELAAALESSEATRSIAMRVNAMPAELQDQILAMVNVFEQHSNPGTETQQD